MIDIRLPIQIDQPAAQVYNKEIIIVGEKVGDVSIEKGKGIACLFSPDKQCSPLTDLRRNRKCGTGNTFLVGSKLIILGGVTKDGEIFDLEGQTKETIGFHSYKGLTDSNLVDCASCIY